ncbi:MAG TPA: hypothetical protein VLT33_14865 [Labilithrix sp.]|nr:hypothetical protein [Labilithrix sp.]
MTGPHPRKGNQCGHLVMPAMFKTLFDHALDKRLIDVDIARGEARSAMFVTEMVPEGGQPYIRVIMPGRTDAFDEVADTIHLAHELGHHESWLREDCSEELDELMEWQASTFVTCPQKHSAELRLEVFHEEVRAWVYGRAILSAAAPAFVDWPLFESTRLDALGGYLAGMMLAPDPDAMWKPCCED